MNNFKINIKVINLIIYICKILNKNNNDLINIIYAYSERNEIKNV